MKKRWLWLATVMLTTLLLPAVSNEKDENLQVLESELKREFQILSKQSPSVYYMDYRVLYTKRWSCLSNMGSLISSGSQSKAYVNPTVRVGDKDFDNTHLLKGKRNRTSFTRIDYPISFNENAIRQLLWNITDDTYKRALQEYRYKKNSIKVNDNDSVADFVGVEPVRFIEPSLNVEVSEELMFYMEKLSKEASLLFFKDQDITKGTVNFSFVNSRKYFVSSEGHAIVQNHSFARISIQGTVCSAEGNKMTLHHMMDAFLPEDLPSRDSVYAATQHIVDKLIELKNAPIADPYTGPAILSPSAAGVFFHEIFGHRLEGHRLKDETDGQTFKSKVGELVLPKTFTIKFDPQVKNHKGYDLNGYYHYDDQGVKGGLVEVVNDGVLQDFLMCRNPIKNFSQSNGHGRADIFRAPVSRQSNMFVSTSKPYSEVQLRKMLIKACKKQNLLYGYYFKSVSGGFTNNSRYNPNAFNVKPTEVYKIYVDGRPDELVRGVNLVGTPLSMFSTIQAAGNKEGLFNGYCGAESGSVPVATVSPEIFVGKIETQKKHQKFSTGTILLPPSVQ